jgi:hypothetical protein
VEAAKGGGGALAIQLAESVAILNSSFAHNTAHGDNLDAGAAYLHTIASANISGCSFFNNTADLHVSQQLQCGLAAAACNLAELLAAVNMICSCRCLPS